MVCWLPCSSGFCWDYSVEFLARQTVKETIGVGVNEKAALSSDKTALSFTSISIYLGEQSRVPLADSYGIQSLLFSLSLSYRMFW